MLITAPFSPFRFLDFLDEMKSLDADLYIYFILSFIFFLPFVTSFVYSLCTRVGAPFCAFLMNSSYISKECTIFTDQG
jgi:hypothetical protein